MNIPELTSTITAIANMLSCKMTVSEMALAAGIFVQLGDTIATIAAGRALCEERESEKQAIDEVS